VGDTPSEGLLPGKLPPDLLRELLGTGETLPQEVKLGPALGEDACAIDVPEGTLIAATDPITLTSSKVGAYAVVINANDVAVMGVEPRWFLAAVLLPTGTRISDVRELFEDMRSALDEVGAHLVGGHTEVTDAVAQPVVVGQMLGLAKRDGYVRTGGVRPGHAVIQVGRVPIEGAAVLAGEAAKRLTSLPEAELERARAATHEPGISVVKPALLAAELGATALHDPTEGGLAAGLEELALASEVRLCVDESAVLWFEPGVAVCRALGADPFGALASGSLLAAFPAERAEAAIAALEAGGFEARSIATAMPGAGVLLADGTPLPHFERDEVARVLARLVE